MSEGTTTYFAIDGGDDRRPQPPFCYAYPTREAAETAAHEYLRDNADKLLTEWVQREIAEHMGIDTFYNNRGWRTLVPVRRVGDVEVFIANGNQPAVSAPFEAMVLRKVQRQETGSHGVPVTVETVEEWIPWTATWPHRPGRDYMDGKPIVADAHIRIDEHTLRLPRPADRPRVWAVRWGAPDDLPLPESTATMHFKRWRWSPGTVTAYCIGDSPAEIAAIIPEPEGDWWREEPVEVPWQTWRAVTGRAAVVGEEATP